VITSISRKKIQMDNSLVPVDEDHGVWDGEF
jgi:hypothetical protein